MRLKPLMALLVVMFCASISIAHAKEDAYLEPTDEEWGDLDSAQEVRNAANNAAYYGWVNDEADVDAFHFTFDEAVSNFNISLNVPQCSDSFEAFYPSIAVIGAGLETPEDVELPFDLPEGTGAVIITEPALEGIRRVSMSEPYNLYVTGMHSLDLEAGDYWIAVWDADASAGAYLLRTMHTHPDFDDYTDQDWRDMEAAYSAINGGGWVSGDCEAAVTTASSSS